MDAKLNSVNRALKALDSDLYAERSHRDVIHVMRWLKGPKYLFSLTDTWTSEGTPVDWGIQPVIDHYRDGDPDAQGLRVLDLQKLRERKKELRQRENRNTNRAMALDLRREFAKASNDINTSTLEKVDPRRNQNGYR